MHPSFFVLSAGANYARPLPPPLLGIDQPSLRISRKPLELQLLRVCRNASCTLFIAFPPHYPDHHFWRFFETNLRKTPRKLGFVEKRVSTSHIGKWHGPTYAA